MNKLLLILPLLASGCFHATFADPAPALEPRIVSTASGTTGSVSYACNQLDSVSDDITFTCQFHNETDRVQLGPTVKIALFSETTNRLVAESTPIFADTVQPNQTDTKQLIWPASVIRQECGYSLQHCVVLVDKKY